MRGTDDDLLSAFISLHCMVSLKTILFLFLLLLFFDKPRLSFKTCGCQFIVHLVVELWMFTS